MLKKALFETVASLIATVWAVGDIRITEAVHEIYLEDKDRDGTLFAVVYILLYVPFIFVYNILKTKLFDK